MKYTLMMFMMIVKSGVINPSIKLDHSQLPLLNLALLTAKGSTVTVVAPLIPFLLYEKSTLNMELGTPEL